jgi:hypothetical protein
VGTIDFAVSDVGREDVLDVPHAEEDEVIQGLVLGAPDPAFENALRFGDRDDRGGRA